MKPTVNDYAIWAEYYGERIKKMCEDSNSESKKVVHL